MSEPALLMSEPRSLIKATCITRSNSTSIYSGNTGRGEALSSARMIRGSGLSGSAINPQ
jgi:hypothetical protein